MRPGLVAMIVVMAWLGSTPASAQTGNTPSPNRALQLEPIAGELGTAFDSMVVVAQRSGYIVTQRIDWNTGSGGGYRLTTLKSDLQTGYGLWAQTGHGFQSSESASNGQWGFTAEVWLSQTDATNAATNYRNNGTFAAGDFFVQEITGGPLHAWALCPTSAFLGKYCHLEEMLVYDATCSSLNYADGWKDAVTGIPARAVLGYQDVCVISGAECSGMQDIFDIWGNLNGMRGNGYCSLGQAYNERCYNSNLRVKSGSNLQTWLAPTIDVNASTLPTMIDHRTTAHVVFRTAMDTNMSPSDFVLGTPATRAYNPHWTSPTEIQFDVVGRRQDYGDLWVYAYNPNSSPVFPGARSAGWIPMDGNGQGYTGNPFGWTCSSHYVDTNPGSRVYLFSVTWDGSDVRVAWSADQEDTTSRYLVTYAPDWNGTFLPVTDVAVGTGTYMMTVPNGAEGIYRLQEVEKDGTVVDLDGDPVGPPTTISNLIPAPTKHDAWRADSLMSMSTNMAQMMQTNQLYTIFTPRFLTCPANNQRDFWNAVGLPTQVKVIEDLGGMTAIKPYITAHPEITSVLFYGDGTMAKDVNGADIWDRTDQWNTMGFGPKPNRNLRLDHGQIGLYYTVDPDSQSMGVSYFTRSIGSPFPYVDRNNNGKPDDGIRWGVAPVGDTLMAWAFNYKTQNAWFQWVTPGVGLWSFLRGGTNEEWNFVKQIGDSLQRDLSPWQVPSTIRDWFPAPMTTQQRLTLPVNAINQGLGLILATSIYDDWRSIGYFMQKSAGFSMSMLNNQNHLVAIIHACGASAYDMPEDSTGVPIAEMLLCTADKGAYLIWGPNRGSKADKNYKLIHAVLTEVNANPYPYYTKPFGDIINDGELVAMAQDTTLEMREIVWSSILLGDPNLPLKVPGPPTVGVGTLAQSTRLTVYPNPGRQVDISLSLPEPGPASLDVFDVQGRRVATLLTGQQSAGQQSVRWTGRGQSGVYLLRLTTPRQTFTKRFALLQ